MRKAGRRIPWKVLINEAGSTGNIRTSYCSFPDKAPYRVAVLVGTPALPHLFEPQLLDIADDVVLLRGYERIQDQNGTFTVLQEWRCEPLCGCSGRLIHSSSSPSKLSRVAESSCLFRLTMKRYSGNSASFTR